MDLSNVAQIAAAAVKVKIPLNLDALDSSMNSLVDHNLPTRKNKNVDKSAKVMALVEDFDHFFLGINELAAQKTPLLQLVAVVDALSHVWPEQLAKLFLP